MHTSKELQYGCNYGKFLFTESALELKQTCPLAIYNSQAETRARVLTGTQINVLVTLFINKLSE